MKCEEMIRNLPRVLRKVGNLEEKSLIDVFDTVLRQWFSILAATLVTSRELKNQIQRQQQQRNLNPRLHLETIGQESLGRGTQHQYFL